MPKKTGNPDRIQSRFENADEQSEFVNAWKELFPDMDWSLFCKRMLKLGISEEQWNRDTLKKLKLIERKRILHLAETGEGEAGPVNSHGHIKDILGKGAEPSPHYPGEEEPAPRRPPSASKIRNVNKTGKGADKKQNKA